MQFLFQADFHPDERARALERFWRDKPAAPKLRQFADALIQGVLEHQPELDRKIQEYAVHWDLNRMSGVDRNILRLALYEMLHRPDIPPVVSINEAIEIAKAFSSLEGGKFVNGILDRAKADLTRPSRVAVADEAHGPA